MSHERRLLIEKIQVSAAVILGITLVYCVLWPLLRPGQLDHVAAFVAEGAWGKLFMAVAMLMVISLMAAIITAFSRPQGAMVAALAALAALGMHSEPTRLLINRFEDRLPALGIAFISEIVVWTVAIWAATVLMRMLWLRLAQLVVEDVELENPSALWMATGLLDPAGGFHDRSKLLKDFAFTTLIRAVASLVWLKILLNSAVDPERGQVIFAIFASFCISSLFVSWSGVRVDSDLSAIVGVALAAIGIGVTMAMFEPEPPLTWLRIKSWCHALPIDWMAAGGCGSLAGRWWALRIVEASRQREDVVETDSSPELRYIDAKLINSAMRHEPTDEGA